MDIFEAIAVDQEAVESKTAETVEDVRQVASQIETNWLQGNIPEYGNELMEEFCVFILSYGDEERIFQESRAF